MKNQNGVQLPIKCLSDVEQVDLLSLPHISCGIKSLDRLIKGLFESQLVVITGKRGQGKSTFASWILANALDQGKNIFAYSGELPDYNFRSWLDMQIAGQTNINTEYNEWNDANYTIKEEAAEKLSEFYACRAYIYDNSAIPDKTVTLQETILSSIEYAADNLGCKVILVDNIMTAVNMLDKDAYAVQSGFVKDLKDLATRKKVTILLIAHPRKTKQGEEINNDDVSGSSDITNLADVVLTYSRYVEKDNRGNPVKSNVPSEYQSIISVMKNRLTGRTAMFDEAIKVKYSRMTKRIISDDDKDYNKLMCCFKPEYLPF